MKEFVETLQMKRRRMLQFSSDSNETGIGSEQFTSLCLKSKVREGSLMENGLSENLEWDYQWNTGYQEFFNISHETGIDVLRETPNPSPIKFIMGRNFFLKTPKKLVTLVVYPFTLMKPCGVQGDVTLKDINLVKSMTRWQPGASSSLTQLAEMSLTLVWLMLSCWCF